MTVAEQLEMIAQGTDPMTGEVFDVSDLRNDVRLNNAIRSLAVKAIPGAVIPKTASTNALNRPVDTIADRLREWRLNTASIVGLPAYCIFSDKTMYNIAAGDIVKKDDLLRIPGFGPKLYDLYGDEVYDILREFIE